MLRQVEAADRIRAMFFRPGSRDAEVRFSVAASELDAASTRFLLEVDGQAFDYRHGSVIAKPMTWPGLTPGPAAVTFEERAGVRPNFAFTGPWAWFRLLDSAQVERKTDSISIVTIEGGGHLARIRVESNTLNPFGKQALQQFRCE